MKRYIVAFLILNAFNNTVQAQPDQRTVSTRIADVLARIPARDSVQARKNNHVIGSLGKDGLKEMIAMLADAGHGDNTVLEFAIGGFSSFVMKYDSAGWRDRCITAYIEALKEEKDTQNKAFIIRQLQIVGNELAIPVLKNYLSDEKLSDPAARALVKINTLQAGRVLLEALTESSGNPRLTLIQALGDLHFSDAAPHIQKTANTGDSKLNAVSIYALAKIGNPSSEKTLADAARKSGFIYEPNNFTAAYIIYARQLAENNKKWDAARIANTILKNTPSDKQIPARTAALRILTSIQAEKSVPLLIRAMDNNNEQYRAAALRYALAYTKNPEIRQWIEQLKRSEGKIKAEIITMLGEAGNMLALSETLNALDDKNEIVRFAAINATVQLGGAKAVPVLLETIKKGLPGDISTASLAIRSIEGSGVTDQVAEALATTPGAAAKAALIDFLSSRSAVKHLKAVMPFLSSEEGPVRISAFSALKNLVKASDMKTLSALLTQTKRSGEIAAIQEALVTAANTIPDTRERIAAVRSLMDGSPEKAELFFPVFSGLGGTQASRVIKDKFDKGNDQIKQLAVNALANWNDVSATATLWQILRLPANHSSHDTAFAGYVRLTMLSEYPAAKKLLMLRNAMTLANGNYEKMFVLKEMEKCKVLNALVFAGQYLDDPVLQMQAAETLAGIALSDTSFNGPLAHDLLQKSLALLSGTDSQRKKEGLQRRINTYSNDHGFRSLINENDLSGWEGFNADAFLFKTMPVKKPAKNKTNADANGIRNWSVRDGQLTGMGGSAVATVKKYGDFELFVDCQVTDSAGAGAIFVRGVPLFEFSGKATEKSGSGNDGITELTLENPEGEWNSFHIIMKGDRASVFENGTEIMNRVVLENSLNPELPIPSEGQIALYASGSGIRYRDFYIKEMAAIQPFVLSDEEKNDGFSILFDGSNMFQWTGNMTDHIMENGNISVEPKNWEHSNLYTKSDYADFILRFEFQLTPHANSGIGIRAPAPVEGHPGYSGTEIQILDDDADIYKNLKPYQYHGSVYGVIAAKRGFLKPTGDWNYQEISVIGSKIKVILNGATIVDGDMREASKNGTIDGKNHPYLLRSSGRIGLLGHGDRVKFRNIRIKPIVNLSGNNKNEKENNKKHEK
ncbi:MAG TPA: DUF1080 domain-containing protein [Flavitalea sp.]|nr:DUF1080 domain-containing protein [Flavitalea sp.]